jgi:DNA-binding NtrC family response regulator
LGKSSPVEEMSNKRVDQPTVLHSPNPPLGGQIEIPPTPRNTGEAAFALVIDDESNICELVATTLGKLGIDSATFSTAQPAVASIDQRWPVIIFLDVVLEQSDAYDVIRGLSEKHYDGIVQLMSSGRPWLLEALQRLATRHGLTLCPPIQKPVQDATIRALIARVGLTGRRPFQVGKID